MSQPNRLAEIRQLRGLSQRQLAEASGLHALSISKWESGRLRPLRTSAEALARVLDVSVEELGLAVYGEDPPARLPELPARLQALQPF